MVNKKVKTVVEDSNSNILGLKFSTVHDRFYHDSLVEDRTIKMFSGVDEDFAYTCVHLIERLNKLDSVRPIKLIISSPGGLVYAGMAVYDAMQNSKAPIETIATGWAMSMGSVLLVGGHKGLRKATKTSTIMLHEPSTIAFGKSSQIDNEAKEMNRIRDLINDIYIKHSDGKLTKKKIKQIMTKDSYLTADQALDLGLIDQVL